MTSKEALQQIMTIYGETNSLEGTYDLFKKIKKDLERLQELEVANRNNENVIADSVKLLNRNLELQSRLETLEKENKELWENIENYNHKFAEVERKKCDLILENEKLKKAFKILTQRIVIKAHKNFLFGGRHLDIASTTMKLTDEEYDLLKEVMNNENHSE